MLWRFFMSHQKKQYQKPVYTGLYIPPKRRGCRYAAFFRDTFREACRDYFAVVYADQDGIEKAKRHLLGDEFEVYEESEQLQYILELGLFIATQVFKAPQDYTPKQTHPFSDCPLETFRHYFDEEEMTDRAYVFVSDIAFRYGSKMLVYALAATITHSEERFLDLLEGLLATNLSAPLETMRPGVVIQEPGLHYQGLCPRFRDGCPAPYPTTASIRRMRAFLVRHIFDLPESTRLCIAARIVILAQTRSDVKFAPETLVLVLSWFVNPIQPVDV